MTEHSTGVDPVSRTGSSASTQALNDAVEQMQLTYINAEARGDRDEMTQAAMAASRLRQLGATLGSEGTAATRALRNYYSSNPLVTEVMKSPWVTNLNKVIWQAKNDWAYANKTNDTAGMKAAAALSENMRKMGGTVTEAMTFQNLKALNDSVEQMQLKSINAEIRGDRDEMVRAAMAAADLRQRGATLGAEGTGSTQSLRRYYDSDPLVKQAVQTRNTMDLNKAIWKAKNDYAYAYNTNDQSAMKAAVALGDNMRVLGGTITDSMTLQQAQDIAFPDIDKLNENVELAKLRYINAQMRGDQAAMTAAHQEAQRLRGLGATQGEGDTAATLALKRYYEEDIFVKSALANPSVEALNFAIWKSKNDWLYANDTNDPAAKKAAELIGENMRIMGGTIGANVSLEESYRIAFKGVDTSPSSGDAPKTDEEILDRVWGYVEPFLSIPEIKESWQKLISPDSTPWEKLSGGAVLAFNLYLDASMIVGIGAEAKLLYQLGKAGLSAGRAFLTRTAVKEAEAVTLGMTKAQMGEHLKQRGSEIRGQLPGDLKNPKEGNVGVASIEIKGLPAEMKAFSRINDASDEGAEGFVLLRENRLFETKFVDIFGKVNSARSFDRKYDTESKILEEVAARLGNNPTVSGTIDLFTERLACASCSDIILAFRRRYPNIKVNVYTRD
ncbi:MAG: deaminase domain-containing protein [Halobacteriota archaeon]